MWIRYGEVMDEGFCRVRCWVREWSTGRGDVIWVVGGLMVEGLRVLAMVLVL